MSGDSRPQVPQQFGSAQALPKLQLPMPMKLRLAALRPTGAARQPPFRGTYGSTFLKVHSYLSIPKRIQSLEVQDPYM